MSLEIELKLQLLPSSIHTLLALECLSSGRKKTFTVKNTYYDTQDALLAKHKVALRVRQKGNQYIQTLKTQGDNQGGLHVRSEFEYPLNNSELDLSLIQKELVDHLQIDDLSQLVLAPVFLTDFNRTEIQLSDIEVVFDQGSVTYKHLTDSLCECELELIGHVTSESQYAKLTALFDLADKIAQHISVMPSDVSKALRGERLKQIDAGNVYVIDVKAPLAKESEKEVDSAHDGNLINLKQHVGYWLECVQSNWEAFYFSKQSHYLTEAIHKLQKIKQALIKDNPIYEATILILNDVIHTWNELCTNISDEAINGVLQNKQIGQMLLNISRWCHSAGQNESGI